MKNPQVRIDFNAFKPGFKKFILEKARRSNSTILYKKGDQLIEEDPNTLQTKILK